MVIRVEQGKGKKDRYVILSPILLEIFMSGRALRARRAGCLPLSPGCFPATAGGIRVRASCIGSFAWQPGVPASPSGSAFIRCGTASPPISWSKRPISASSKFLLGHKKLDTTALYTRVAISTIGQVTSPLDVLRKMPG